MIRRRNVKMHPFGLYCEELDVFRRVSQDNWRFFQRFRGAKLICVASASSAKITASEFRTSVLRGLADLLGHNDRL